MKIICDWFVPLYEALLDIPVTFERKIDFQICTEVIKLFFLIQSSSNETLNIKYEQILWYS